jgi:2-dehydro-3-deoxygluconokinase
MRSRVITFGEIMLRLSPPGAGRFVSSTSFNALYAGSEANVAASLSFLGVPAAHVTCFPDNDLGKAAIMSLRQYGVDTSHIALGEGRIGVYFIEGGSSIRSPKIIYDRFDSAFANLDPASFEWDKIMDGAEWFHWSGITPAISQSAADACRQAILAARKRGLMVSGDINYRRNLWQYGKTAKDVMPELIESSDFLIAGITDFENCLGITGSDFVTACKNVSARYPNVKKVATAQRTTHDSSHQALSGLLWNGKELLKSREYELSPIVDRVGAGDAFMAGIICGYLNKGNDQRALDVAVAACALKHTVEGDVNTSTMPEIDGVIKGENVGKLLR